MFQLAHTLVIAFLGFNSYVCMPWTGHCVSMLSLLSQVTRFPLWSLFQVPMAASAAIDPDALVDQYLFHVAQIQRTHKDYQLLRVRDKATTQELKHVHKCMAKHLHPDKGGLVKWAMSNYTDLDKATLDEAQVILGDFWTTWQNTCMKLQEIDDGLFQKDPPVHV